MITKGAKNTDLYKRDMYFYKRARDAFKDIIVNLKLKKNECIALPAYIGWSPIEGSGVFDPVIETGANYVFYKVDKNLNIDMDDYKRIIDENEIKLSVIIHYFGFIDDKYKEFIEISKEKSIFILEDEAHSMYSDLIGGISGRMGDACIFSLHKMLPVDDGGILVLNNNTNNIIIDNNGNKSIDFYKFDLKEIARKRIENFDYMNNKIEELGQDVKKLRNTLKEGEIPQTYPVLIENISRFELYKLLNKKGFGVVSLYHTMIENLREFEDTKYLSQRILNLPIHQDVNTDDIDQLIKVIKECIEQLKN